MYFAYNAILDSTAISQLEWNAKAAINGALADAWLHASSSGVALDYPGNATARNSINGRPFFVSILGQRLTTRLLLECASSLDELYVMAIEPARSSAPGILAMVTAALDHTDYGLAFRVAGQVSPVLRKSLSTLLAVIDFALNPPVPGISLMVEGMSWSELYPPTRFMEAIAWCDTEHQLPDSPSRADLLGFRGHLEQKTGLRYGTVARPLSVAADLPGALASLEHSDVREVNLYIAHRLLHLRDSDPALVSHFGTAFIGDGAIRLLETESWNDALFPFMFSSNDKFSHSDYIDKKLASNYLVKVAVECVTDDLVNGIGPLTVDHLPRDFAQTHISDLVQYAWNSLGIAV